MNLTISLVALFYNEERSVEAVVREGHAVLKSMGEPFEIVAIQNGSLDSTPEILVRLQSEFTELRRVVISTNRGAGYGARRGWYEATGKYVIGISGDGQVDLQVIPSLLQSMQSCCADLDYGKRIERPDGPVRAEISSSYKLLMRVIFGLQSKDINGLPKILTRTVLQAMQLRSDDHFLECEMMLKAQRLGLRICSTGVQFHARRDGRSSIRWQDCLTYLRNLSMIRLGLHARWGMADVPQSTKSAEWLHFPRESDIRMPIGVSPAASLSSTTR